MQVKDLIILEEEEVDSTISEDLIILVEELIFSLKIFFKMIFNKKKKLNLYLKTQMFLR